MRISSSSFSDTLVVQLNQIQNQQATLQAQAATGQRIQVPSDDPNAVAQALGVQTESSAVAQYQQNISAQTAVAGASYNAISSLKTISDRASEIATLADGTKSQADLNTYATELNQLIQQGVQLANSKYGGNYLFAGTQDSQAPFAAATDSSGQVTAVNYSGNSSVALTEVSEGVTMSASVPGANSTGNGPSGLITDSRTGADFFAHLISLRNNLQAGNTTAISSTDAPALAKDENNLVYQVASNGAVQSRLEASASLATSRTTALTQQFSTGVDADLAQTMTKLSQVQNAYQAALQSAGRIMSVSLLDYLK